MKITLSILLFLLSFTGFAQENLPESLWRTKGVHDSLGNLITRAKIQSFLYAVNHNKFYRLRTQDRINMETGETKVFSYRDTFTLDSTPQKHFKISEKEILTFHTKDSLTIHYNGYSIVYVRLDTPKNTVSLHQLKKVLLNKKMTEMIEGTKEYAFTYQSDNLVEVAPLDSQSKWKSNYKIIDFEGFLILQGIVSAPKLILKANKKSISFLEIDYRFETKNGLFQGD